MELTQVRVSELQKRLAETLLLLYQEQLKLDSSFQFISNNYPLGVSADIDIGLFSPYMIEYIDQLFVTYPVYTDLHFFMAAGPAPYMNETVHAFKLNLAYLDKNLKSITLYAERCLLALASLNLDYDNQPSNSKIEIGLLASRIKAVRQNKSYAFITNNKAASDKVFEERLVPYKIAQKLYNTDPLEVKDVIFAGGDATRYLKVLNLLNANFEKDSDFTEANLEAIKKQAGNEDVSHVLTIPKLLQILKTPMFGYIRYINRLDRLFLSKLNIDNEIASDIKDVLHRFNPKVVPKALNFAYQVDFGDKQLYVSFFLSAVIQRYSKMLKMGKMGCKLYYIVRNQKIAHSLNCILLDLIKSKILDTAYLEVKIVDNVNDSVPLCFDKNFLLFDENQKLRTTSSGHGPALIKTSRMIPYMTDNEGSEFKLFSVRTMDNCGIDVGDYSDFTQQAAIVENRLRNKIVEFCHSGKRQSLAALLKKHDCRFRAGTLTVSKIKSFIVNRWDYNLPKKVTSISDIANFLEKMPITIAVVIKGYSTKGGGLYVDCNGNMAIVDKLKGKKIGNSVRFNPMLYSVLLKEEFSPEMESEHIFVAKKGRGSDIVLQGESASTHIATNPKYVLKRMIEVDKSEIGKVFQEQKTLDQSHQHYTEKILIRLKQDILNIAAVKNLDINQLLEVLESSQESALDYLHRKVHDANDAAIKILFKSNGIEYKENSFVQVVNSLN